MSISSCLIKCSTCMREKCGLSQNDQIQAIERINRSIGWDHYNAPIEQIIKQSGHNLILAVQDGQIFGYAVQNAIKRIDGIDKAYVPYIAVDISRQRNKVGSRLMERIFHKAMKHGISALSLDFRGQLHDAPAGIENEKLVNFYSSLPYQSSIEKVGHGSFKNGDVRYSITYDLASPNNPQNIQKVKAFAQENGFQIAQDIQKFKITDQTALIEIAKICAEKCGAEIAHQIQNFEITDEAALIELAKMCAR